MSDLIERQEAIDAVKDAIISDEQPYAEDALRNLPSAEPERHRGEWIEDSHERGFSECSKCGYIAVNVLSKRHYNYCPNCGADMTR